LRDFAINKHGQVDDAPFGGEAGMVLRPEPLKAALETVFRELSPVRPHVALMSAQGALLTQERARELAEMRNLLIICGHYKGVDQRICDAHVDEEIGIGDYVVSGGELPAMVLCDAVARLLPGVLNDPESAETDSFQREGRLGWPVYTRPREFEGRVVPEVLLSGHHDRIEAWRAVESLRLTQKNRPDLLEKFALTDAEKRRLQRAENEKKS
jgi:tRNA (guanine37-N1)-methyltransferase